MHAIARRLISQPSFRAPIDYVRSWCLFDAVCPEALLAIIHIRICGINLEYRYTPHHDPFLYSLFYLWYSMHHCTKQLCSWSRAQRVRSRVLLSLPIHSWHDRLYRPETFSVADESRSNSGMPRLDSKSTWVPSPMQIISGP